METFKINDYVYHNGFSLEGKITNIENNIAYVEIIMIDKTGKKIKHDMRFELKSLSHKKMINYKECSIEDFNNAIKSKDADIKTLSNEYLYILYTKFEADAFACYQAGTLYSMEISRKSKEDAGKYKEELQKRGFNVS